MHYSHEDPKLKKNHDPLDMLYVVMMICISPLRSFVCTSQRSENDELINWQISMRSFGKTSNVGDWFFLGLISRNLNETVFQFFMQDLHCRMDPKRGIESGQVVRQLKAHQNVEPRDTQHTVEPSMSQQNVQAPFSPPDIEQHSESEVRQRRPCNPDFGTV